MTARKLVTLRSVLNIRPIPGADNIEVATVDGWECVVKKGEFSPGDKGIYFEVDSFVPAEDDRFMFLHKTFRDWQGKRGAVIRTMRLKGQLSQGLLLPLSSFPEIKKPEFDVDYSEDLGVYKYEKEPDSPIEDRSSWFHKVVIKYLPRSWRKKLFETYRYFFPDKQAGNKRKSSSNFPSFLIRSDEQRVQNLWNTKAFQDKKDVELEVTTKLDGSSASYYFYNKEFGLCSRNQKRSLEDGSHFAYIAKKTNLVEALPKLERNIQILGELMGPKIQGNREKLHDYQYFVYNVYDIDNRHFLGRSEREEVLDKLISLGAIFNRVPFNEILRLNDRFKDLGELLKYAEGKSLVHPIREGIVLKALDGSFSFKVISNEFLLKEKD